MILSAQKMSVVAFFPKLIFALIRIRVLFVIFVFRKLSQVLGTVRKLAEVENVLTMLSVVFYLLLKSHTFEKEHIVIFFSNITVYISVVLH